jgi:4-diphosphocytidyl-2-C-methyl-D-erythritol kinase
MTAWRALAPGKVNLCLFLGPTRQDGLHELVSVVQAVSLADELVLEDGAGESDEVVCLDVEGPNLAGRALSRFREESGWAAGPHRLSIQKRIPIAAGMGGGSADAAATLRLAARAAGSGDDSLLRRVAAELGSDVPAALEPGRALVTGAGEKVERLSDPEPFGALVLASSQRLSTADVFAHADQLGLGRSVDELERLAREVAEAQRAGDWLPRELMVNDLETAARDMCPEIEESFEQAWAVGAGHVLVTGSGPTVVGLFPGPDGSDRAKRGASSLRGRRPPAVAAVPVDAGFGAVEEVGA